MRNSPLKGILKASGKDKTPMRFSWSTFSGNPNMQTTSRSLRSVDNAPVQPVTPEPTPQYDAMPWRKGIQNKMDINSPRYKQMAAKRNAEYRKKKQDEMHEKAREYIKMKKLGFKVKHWAREVDRRHGDQYAIIGGDPKTGEGGKRGRLLKTAKQAEAERLKGISEYGPGSKAAAEYQAWLDAGN